MAMVTHSALALALTASLALAVGSAMAQDSHSGHSMPDAPADATIAEWQAISERMHAGMAIAYTGDVDVDFARGMIAHHQGAVEMAKLAIANGTDPEIRALAENIVAAQTEEIAFLEGWLAQNGE